MEEERMLPQRNIEAEQAHLKQAIRKVRRRRTLPFLASAAYETLAVMDVINFLQDGLQAAHDVGANHANPLNAFIIPAMYLGVSIWFEVLAWRFGKGARRANEQIRILKNDLRSLRQVHD